MSRKSDLALLREQRLAKLRQTTGTPARFAADFAKPPISDMPLGQEKKKPGVSWRDVWMFCVIWMNFNKLMGFFVADRDLANALGLAATITVVWMWRLCSRQGKDPKNVRSGQSGNDADRRLGRTPGVMRIGGRTRR